ncbi:MAG: exodeoxyribonuclease VII large subunit [Myxococcota bacterium]
MTKKERDSKKGKDLKSGDLFSNLAGMISENQQSNHFSVSNNKEPASPNPKKYSDEDISSSVSSTAKKSVKSRKRSGQKQSKKSRNHKKKIWKVSEILSGLNKVIKENFRTLWIEGELINVTKRRGIYYYSLKENDNLIRCISFRNSFRAAFEPEDGIQVRVRGYLRIYEPAGSLSLNVNLMERAGRGSLAQALERLTNKLRKEGLFNKEHKKPIPEFPKNVGVVTSPDGAALRDFIKIARQRFAASLIISPAIVQGEKAPDQIRKAIARLDRMQKVDLIVVTRGGGSFEDLFCFNNEKVVRAVFSCRTPVISAIGHETDTVLTDHAADLRLATPTEAAEHIFKEKIYLKQQLTGLKQHLFHLMRNDLEFRQRRLQLVKSQIHDPELILNKKYRELDYLNNQLQRSFLNLLNQKKTEFNYFRDKLLQFNVEKVISNGERKLEDLKRRIVEQTESVLASNREKLKLHKSTLSALSPDSVLKRGYALVTDKKGKILLKSREANSGDQLNVRLAEGNLEVEVK